MEWVKIEDRTESTFALQVPGGVVLKITKWRPPMGGEGGWIQEDVAVTFVPAVRVENGVLVSAAPSHSVRVGG